MCTKYFLFIATLYVVNASVISHDAYDVNESSAADESSNNEFEEFELKLDKDGEDTGVDFAELFSDLTVLSEQRRCSPRRCNRVCRYKRFYNGTCVDGRCRCSNKVEKIFDNDRPNNFFEESDLNMDEIEGLAFNNRVEESKHLVNVEDTETDAAEYFLDPTDISKKLRCIARLCDLYCRLKGLGNGTCIDGQCECSGIGEQSFVDDLPDNLVKESDLNNNEVEDEAYSNKAENPERNSDKVEKDTETEIAAFFSDHRDLFVKRRCSPRRCDRLCRRKRFATGTCIGGRCKCEQKVPESTTNHYTTLTPEDFITTEQTIHPDWIE